MSQTNVPTLVFPTDLTVSLTDKSTFPVDITVPRLLITQINMAIIIIFPPINQTIDRKHPIVALTKRADVLELHTDATFTPLVIVLIHQIDLTAVQREGSLQVIVLSTFKTSITKVHADMPAALNADMMAWTVDLVIDPVVAVVLSGSVPTVLRDVTDVRIFKPLCLRPGEEILIKSIAL